MTNIIAIELIAAGELTPHPNNANVHSDAQLTLLEASMEEVGWTSPCLCDENNVLLAGHARYEAAQRVWARGGVIANVPTGMVPTVRRTGLTEVQKRKYLLADNRLPAMAVWDAAQLRDEVAFLGVEVFTAGFTQAEVGGWIPSEDFAPIDTEFTPIQAVAPRPAFTGAPLPNVQPAAQGQAFSPNLAPNHAHGGGGVTNAQVERATERLEGRFAASGEQRLLDITCPHCRQEFAIDHPA